MFITSSLTSRSFIFFLLKKFSLRNIIFTALLIVSTKLIKSSYGPFSVEVVNSKGFLTSNLIIYAKCFLSGFGFKTNFKDKYFINNIISSNRSISFLNQD